jgi:hypothetical protein
VTIAPRTPFARWDCLAAGAEVKRPWTLGCLAVLVLTGCRSAPHAAYNQAGDYDSGLQARAADFVAALNAEDASKLTDLVFPAQRNEVAAFIAAYGGRHAVIADFASNGVGPNTEAAADIELTCSATLTITVPQVFSWKAGNWRTYIYLPGQKVGVTDQQCS